MDYLECMKGIQKTIGNIKAADGIIEPQWYVEMGEQLRVMSKQLAIELQSETSLKWDKGSFMQSFYEAPPMRLLSLVLGVSAWLGWVLHEKNMKDSNGQIIDRLSHIFGRYIQDAFNYGVDHSIAKNPV